MDRTIKDTVCPALAPALAKVLAGVPSPLLARISEIRLRAGQPLQLAADNDDYFVGPDGEVVQAAGGAYICTVGDLAQTLKLISRNSLYAYEEELRLGYITIAGGHRIGLAGQAIVQGGQLIAMKNISAMNIRLAREIRGAADLVAAYVVNPPRRVMNTLVISPPRCGKTTVLRDLTRQLSSGIPRLGFSGVQVGLVDERSEIAACQDGVPTIDLGPRTDVLDGCPKAVGLFMLIRAMAPGTVITDELGREADAIAVREALHAGVSVIASVHGRSVSDIASRPHIGALVGEGRFERFVILSDRPTAGTVEEILDGTGSGVLYSRKKGVKVCG
ncbi:MAG TPA: stage III sporulation protein AA [Selenomonadales bacterium]|nr:stage III sporulation protein AA [Selenomonadales bacterium]